MGIVVVVVDIGYIDYFDLLVKILLGYNFILDLVCVGNIFGWGMDVYDLGDGVMSMDVVNILGCISSDIVNSSWYGIEVSSVFVV